MAAVLSNIAVCSISLSRFAEALEWYRAARDDCQSRTAAAGAGGADYNIAYLHYLEGDFLRAIELQPTHAGTLPLGLDAYHEALCDFYEAEIRLELNLNTEASRLAEQVVRGLPEAARDDIFSEIFRTSSPTALPDS